MQDFPPPRTGQARGDAAAEPDAVAPNGATSEGGSASAPPPAPKKKSGADAMKALFESSDVSIRRGDETRVMSRAQEALAELQKKSTPPPAPPATPRAATPARERVARPERPSLRQGPMARPRDRPIRHRRLDGRLRAVDEEGRHAPPSPHLGSFEGVRSVIVAGRPVAAGCRGRTGSCACHISRNRRSSGDQPWHAHCR